MVLNTGSMDWQSSALITRPLFIIFHMCFSIQKKLYGKYTLSIHFIYTSDLWSPIEVWLKETSWNEVYMKQKKKGKHKNVFCFFNNIYFIYTSWLFLKLKSTSSMLLSLKINNLFRKSTSNILQSFKIVTSILKVCLKYTSELKGKIHKLRKST